MEFVNSKTDQEVKFLDKNLRTGRFSIISKEQYTFLYIA